MFCDKHNLAAGPDGKCALCRRLDRKLERAGRSGRDPARRAAIVVVGLFAAVAAYAWIASIVDTQPSRAEPAADAAR
jgi:hypothetical protein